MANPVITNNDTSQLEVFNPKYIHDIVTFAGADTFVAGTIMGRLTADQKWIPYDAAGATGEEVARAILAADLTATGAGDKYTTALLVSGEVDKDKLLCDNGDPVTSLEIAQLLDAGIIVRAADSIDMLDNQ